jgi:hypothetical protein
MDFDGVGGLEASDVAGEVFVEGLAVLVGEDGGMSIAAVFEGILTGTPLAGFCDRPVDFAPFPRAVSAFRSFLSCSC